MDLQEAYFCRRYARDWEPRAEKSGSRGLVTTVADRESLGYGLEMTESRSPLPENDMPRIITNGLSLAV